MLVKQGGTEIYYPITGRWWDGAHHNLTFNYFQNYSRPEVKRVDFSELVDRLIQETPDPDRNILISSEALWSQDIVSFARSLDDCLSRGRKIEIIVTCREHYSLAASFYNHLVKDAFYSEVRSPDQFLIEDYSRFRYAEALPALMHGPYQIRFLNYHPSSTLVPRFFCAIGIRPPPLPEQKNTSLSAKGLFTALALNRLATPSAQRENWISKMQEDPNFKGSALGIFGKKATSLVAHHFEEDRQWLFKACGIELPPPSEAVLAPYQLTQEDERDIERVSAALGTSPENIAAVVRILLQPE